MSAAKAKKKARQRTHRYTSNVFSMFNQAQIQEFKEAFNIIDQNRDGFVDKDDLIEMLTSLGKDPTDAYLNDMINEAPGPINFTMFLTLFGEKLQGTDPEDVIKNAFACFDEAGSGNLQEDRLREVMTTMGDRWTDQMVDELLTAAPVKTGLFDYLDFIRTLKYGTDKDEDPRSPDQQPLQQQQQNKAVQQKNAANMSAPKNTSQAPPKSPGGGGGGANKFGAPKTPTTPTPKSPVAPKSPGAGKGSGLAARAAAFQKR